MHQVNLMDISGYECSYIARSEWLLGTSNCVFTDWCIRTFFSIKDKKPYAHFVVVSAMWEGKNLFETDDYVELEKWIEEHMNEISGQIEKKSEDWIKRCIK